MATKSRRQDKKETLSERFEKTVNKVLARQERARERQERKLRETESSQRPANSS